MDAGAPAGDRAVKRPGILERAAAEPVTAQRIATYRLDHCWNCRDAEARRATGRAADLLHARHVPVIEDGHGPLSGQPCACTTCAAARAVVPGA